MRKMLLGALMTTAFPCAAQTNFDTVQVRTIPITTNVYMLQGAGGNIGVSVGSDAVFVIDDQFAPLTRKILAAIAELTPNPVRFVVNTHWHSDHTGGNENLGQAGAIIYAHENVRRRMTAGQFIDALNSRVEPAPPGALPVVTFKDAVTFHINGDSVTTVHVAPAHTDGDVIIHFTKANVIHMGDTFHNAGLPFVDLSSGGSIHGIIAAADKVLAMSNAQTRIIPGHGPLADRARLKMYRDMVVALRDRVRTLISTGKTADQVVELNIGAPYAKDFPGGHERFVRLAHQELSKK
ncbi:MAG TPA: MBL fold metallo-hydrolase [Gemmatimonadaceae bacterium]|nr:MBL fold metallo-hydrolase [Gemmatimonadaceae bacterium]